MGTCRGSSRRPGRPGGIRTRWIPLGTHLRSRSPREAGRANGCPGRFPLRGPAAAQPRTSAFCGSRRSSDAGGVTGRFSDSSCLCSPSPTAESAGAGAARDRCGVAADASSVASAPEVGCPHEGAQGQLLSDGLGQNPRLPLPGSGGRWQRLAFRGSARHCRLCLHILPVTPHHLLRASHPFAGSPPAPALRPALPE